ncbi:MAG: diaminopimelate decarboxylase, partial [Bacilli bacterium]
TSTVQENGHLNIGGVSAVDLVEQYGTPLYVYDVAHIRNNIRALREAFEETGVPFQIAYASKAFSSMGMIQLVAQEGITLDVVSEGELYTALAAGFPAEHIHFHGNNKSVRELAYAVDQNIGCFVVDSWLELERLETLGKERGKKIAVLLRLSPGIEAHTHEYILTGNEDSKFGFDLGNGDAKRAIVSSLACKHLDVLGVHVHIGSQIFETTGFEMAIEKIMNTLVLWREAFGFVARVFNVGGGFGIRYVKTDQPLALGEYVKTIVDKMRTIAENENYPLPCIWTEPGRSIVGEAGTTLYQIGARKEIPGVRTYVSVDGGMTDNIRPALYEAEYECALANRMHDPVEETVSIAGKCCES